MRKSAPSHELVDEILCWLPGDSRKQAVTLPHTIIPTGELGIPSALP